jgi:hydrogenase expression/formation protein HypC
MAVPSRIIAIDGALAIVECFGVERSVNLMLMNETVGVGDFVIVQSGAFAVEKVEPEAAHEALHYLQQVIGTMGDDR